MKYIFLAIAVILTILSVIRAMTLPDQSSKVPVIYWTTDPNPARTVQIELFHKWLIKNGYVTKEGTPIVELRLDTANNTAQKVIVQGVSGVGSDIWDMFSGPTVRLHNSIGLLEDVTEAGKELSFSPDFTFPALYSDLTINDRQYASLAMSTPPCTG
ncbi:MAG: hypothetical protein HC898_03865 [Phycisphaerales bacterium]|nr:hypothetical protein [Phycisphaerales bacterium]